MMFLTSFYLPVLPWKAVIFKNWCWWNLVCSCPLWVTFKQQREGEAANPNTFLMPPENSNVISWTIQHTVLMYISGILFYIFNFSNVIKPLSRHSYVIDNLDSWEIKMKCLVFWKKIIIYPGSVQIRLVKLCTLC